MMKSVYAVLEACLAVAPFITGTPLKGAHIDQTETLPCPPFSSLPTGYTKLLNLGLKPRSSLEIESNRFGTHTVVLREGEMASDRQSVYNLLRFASNAGYKWVKDYVAGEGTDGSDAEALTNAYDSQINSPRYLWFFQTAKALRLRALVRIDFTWKSVHHVTWGTDCIEGRKAYALFCQRIVHRYKQYVSDWEIMNEPNAPTYDSADVPVKQLGGRPTVTPSDYVATIRAAYSAIKAEDPGARIYGPGMSYEPTVQSPYFRELLATGILQALDVFSFHPYRDMDPINARFGHGLSFLEVASMLRSQLDETSPAKAIPLASTEEGYSASSTGAPDDAQLSAQAAWEQRSEILDQEAGLGPCINYLLFRRDGSSPPYDRNYRLLDLTKGILSPRPAYYAVQKLHAILDDSATPAALTIKITNARDPARIQTLTFERSHSQTREKIIFIWKGDPPNSLTEPTATPSKLQPPETTPEFVDIRIPSNKWIAPISLDLSPSAPPKLREISYERDNESTTLKRVPITGFATAILIFPTSALNKESRKSDPISF